VVRYRKFLDNNLRMQILCSFECRNQVLKKQFAYHHTGQSNEFKNGYFYNKLTMSLMKLLQHGGATDAKQSTFNEHANNQFTVSYYP